jgi:hypothetical protein
MAVTVVEMVTADQVRRRRAEVLASVGGDESELRARGDLYLLTAEELAAVTELDELDYLLSAAG